MKIFYDLEFLERGPELPIMPISIGMVRDDGQQFYAINLDMQLSLVTRSLWLQTNVIPHLPIRVGDQHSTMLNTVVEWDGEHPDIHHVMTRDAIAAKVKEFITEYDFEEWGKPELWGYYSGYDHVVLAQLFGDMTTLPAGIPMYTNDLMQEWTRLGQPAILPAQTNEHRALDDALWNQEAWTVLDDWADFTADVLAEGRITGDSDVLNAFRVFQNR